MRSQPRYRPPDGFFRYTKDSRLLASVTPREVRFEDEEYPDGVRTMPGAPDRLWVVGRDLRSFGSMVTVIGARRATQYGVSMARRLAGDLAVGGVCVVSGMARGCDAGAHDGALEAGGATIAVLASGADVCYPTSSRTLYAEIAAKGAIVSPNPPGYKAYKSDFIYRNDVMVAMSVAVVVVQGDGDSAAVKTGGRAAGRGRGRVFAVPGSIEWPQSEGVHQLLREGAKICTQASDIAKELEDEIIWNPPKLAAIPDHLSREQRLVLEALSLGPAGREEILSRTGLDASTASIAITRLELRHFVIEEGFLLRRTR